MHDATRRRLMTHALTRLELKTVMPDGTFDGYACLFDTVDLGQDLVHRGAFARSLLKRRASGIRLLFQHDAAQPIGVWSEIREDARGLYVRGHLATEVQKARDVLVLMRAGAIDGLSIGFRAVKAHRDAGTGVRRIAEIDLWEISIVTFPMQPDARVHGVKARPFAERLPTEREFERWLTRDAGLTRTEARAVLHDGLDGLAALRDAGAGSGAGDRLSARIREAARLLRANRQ